MFELPPIQKGFMALAACFAAVLVCGILSLFLWLSGMYSLFGQILVIICGVVFVFQVYSHLYQWFSPETRMTIILIAVISVALSILAAEMMHVHRKNVPVLSEKPDLTLYNPFQKGSKVAVPDGPSELTLTDDLPMPDGSAVLYPVYSAFIHSVYPQGDYTSYGLCHDTTDMAGACARLSSGRADVIFIVDEEPSPQFRQILESGGLEFRRVPLGREALVFFVNSGNPVEGLTTDNLRDIYSGAVTNWREVGGKSRKIRAFQSFRPECAPVMKRIMGDVGMIRPPQEARYDSWKPFDIYHASMSYRNDDNALGYTLSFFVRENFQEGQIRLLSIDGIFPTPETIRDGSYPLTVGLYAVTLNPPNVNTQKLIDWIVSDQGQSLIEKSGFVPIR